MAVTGTFAINHENVGFPEIQSYGSFTLNDAVVDENYQTGYIIDVTRIIVGDSTFIQNKLLPYDSNGLCLSLYDRTYVGGTLVDGTYSGGQYVIRHYTPIDIHYSIWSTYDGTSQQGCPTRTPYIPQTGTFCANMYTPNTTGPYEIRWRYQKDTSSYVTELREPFQVQSWGIDPNRT